LRCTERRPDLYKSCSDIFGDCTDVLEIVDLSTNRGHVLQFGKMETPTRSWLWDYRGRLLVISTPFRDGVHYATRPKHFIPVVEHLDKMHKRGFVHGDIRAYNMVLQYTNDESEQENNTTKHDGWLIDFDFGGKLSNDLTPEEKRTIEEKHSHGYLNPKYPRGYVDELNDGSRLGLSGNDITESHDWYALGKIIFELHKVVHPKLVTKNIVLGNQALTDEQRLIKEQKTHLADLQETFTDMKGDYAELSNPDLQWDYHELSAPGNFLKSYLSYAKECEFELVPTEGFEKYLRKCNMLESNKPRVDSKGATGSPSKRK
jgi:serine/threonine protein kinase